MSDSEDEDEVGQLIGNTWNSCTTKTVIDSKSDLGNLETSSHHSRKLSESELGLISESVLDDKHSLYVRNDLMLQQQLQAKQDDMNQIELEQQQLRERLIKELRDNGKDLKPTDETIERDIMELWSISKDPTIYARYFYYFRELPLVETKDWITSTNRQVLKSTEQSLSIHHIDKSLPKNVRHVDLGINENWCKVKLHHENLTSDINLLKVKIFIKYNVIYNCEEITEIYKMFFRTLLDDNLRRYHYMEVVEFCKLFEIIYQRYPITVDTIYEILDNVLNQIKIYGDVDTDGKLYYERFKYQILELMNQHVRIDLTTKLTAKFMAFEDLVLFVNEYNQIIHSSLRQIHKNRHNGVAESNSVIYKYHYNLRLLNFVVQNYDHQINELPKVITNLTAIKKTYQHLMHQLSAVPGMYYLLNVIHEDFNYLNYYQVKFEKYNAAYKQNDFYN